ncbi:MAG: 23S rRNA (guanosine(2251)-2'-O)-methyltransferase RlmB [Hyphomicrobiaceae bacterium]
MRIFGIHAVGAVLANPQRPISRLLLTDNARHRLAARLAARGVEPEPTAPRDLDRLLGGETVHQGALVETGELPTPDLAGLVRDAGASGPAPLLVVLDQVTDPHNVGAVLRSAAVFGVAGLVLTWRNSPPSAGVLAKVASGGLEHVPVVRVGNLARALAELGELGVTRIGLDGEAEAALEDVAVAGPVALVLGAEEKGLRRLTRDCCDRICRISTFGAIQSLNVSNAAAIAMHTVRLVARRAGTT